MADDDDLRFTMDLKDEFSAVFNRIKDEVNNVVPKLKSNLGGLSKALTVVTAGAAIGGAVFSAWTLFKNKIAAVTKEAEALETTLANILGSKGAARGVIDELANSDLSKVFSIKEIDAGYVKLANNGLRLTAKQMKNIGDLSANSGKGMSAVVSAIIGGGEGKISSLQNLGIDVVKNRDKKAGIDNLTLSFRGQTQTIKNNSAEIQKYLLQLGSMPGIMGSMERSTNTVAAAENSLNNQVSKLWGTLGEKFNPSVVESKSQMSKWVATINDWISLPVETKIGNEIIKIRGLQTELTSSNVSEERRRDILKELHEINPKITEGINAESLSYANLAKNIDAVTGALTKKITLSQIEKRYKDVIEDYSSAANVKAQAVSAVNQAIYAASPELAKRTDLSQGQKQMEAIRILRSRGAKDFSGKTIGADRDDYYQSARGNLQAPDGTPFIDNQLTELKIGIKIANKMTQRIDKLTPSLNRMEDEKNTLTGEVSKVLGLDAVAGSDAPGSPVTGGTSIDKGGIASVSGGGQIKNVTINIQNLVSGGVNVQTTTLKEGVNKAKDIVIEGLLTAVNDANLVGN